MNSLTGFALCLAAFTALSLAMDRHHAQVWGHVPAPARRLTLRGLGWVLVVASCAYCIHAFGVGIGLVAWCALLNVAGLLLAWLLPYRAKVVLPLTGVIALVATVCRLALKQGGSTQKQW